MTAKEVVAKLMSDEHADDLASRCAGWTTYVDVRISDHAARAAPANR